MARIEIRSFGVLSQDKGEAHGGIAIFGDDGKLIAEHHGFEKSFKTGELFRNLSEREREGGGYIGGVGRAVPDPFGPAPLLGTRHFGNTWFDTTEEVARAVDEALKWAGKTIDGKRIGYSLLAIGKKRNSGSVLAAYARVVAETVKGLTGETIAVPDYVTDNSIRFLESGQPVWFVGAHKEILTAEEVESIVDEQSQQLNSVFGGEGAVEAKAENRASPRVDQERDGRIRPRPLEEQQSIVASLSDDQFHRGPRVSSSDSRRTLLGDPTRGVPGRRSPLGRVPSTSVARPELRRRAVGAGIFVGACRWAPMVEANEFAVRREMRDIVRGEREAADSIERPIQQQRDPGAVNGFRPDRLRQHIELTRGMEREIAQEAVRRNQPKFTPAEMGHVKGAYFDALNFGKLLAGMLR